MKMLQFNGRGLDPPNYEKANQPNDLPFRIPFSNRQNVNTLRLILCPLSGQPIRGHRLRDCPRKRQQNEGEVEEDEPQLRELRPNKAQVQLQRQVEKRHEIRSNNDYRISCPKNVAFRNIPHAEEQRDIRERR